MKTKSLPKKPVPPKTPVEPKKPEEPTTRKVVYENKLLTFEWNLSGQSFRLSEIIKYLPEELDLQETLISVENDDGFVKLYLSFPVEVDNKDYNFQLKTYKIKLEKYNQEMMLYEKQLQNFHKENEEYHQKMILYKNQMLEVETSKELEEIKKLEAKLEKLKKHVNKDSK